MGAIGSHCDLHLGLHCSRTAFNRGAIEVPEAITDLLADRFDQWGTNGVQLRYGAEFPHSPCIAYMLHNQCL